MARSLQTLVIKLKQKSDAFIAELDKQMTGTYFLGRSSEEIVKALDYWDKSHPTRDFVAEAKILIETKITCPIVPDRSAINHLLTQDAIKLMKRCIKVADENNY